MRHTTAVPCTIRVFDACRQVRGVRPTQHVGMNADTLTGVYVCRQCAAAWVQRKPVSEEQRQHGWHHCTVYMAADGTPIEVCR